MKRAFFALFLAATLSGCATSWVVDSDVKSFSSLPTMPSGATYRFERLPSQQADAARQESLEAMAAAALEKVGLRRDDARPTYSAQIGARVTAGLSPWADPWLFDGPWGYEVMAAMVTTATPAAGMAAAGTAARPSCRRRPTPGTSAK